MAFVIICNVADIASIFGDLVFVSFIIVCGSVEISVRRDEKIDCVLDFSDRLIVIGVVLFL